MGISRRDGLRLVGGAAAMTLLPSAARGARARSRSASASASTWDNPHFLGKGTIDFPAVMTALADIGFDKWAQLETDAPTRPRPRCSCACTSGPGLSLYAFRISSFR